PFLDFSLESLALYPDWVEALEAESGVEVEYRACGKLRLARTGEEIGELERARDLAQARGLHAELVPAEALAHEVSGMAPGWTWGLRVREDHRVDPRRLGEALLTAARRAGVEVRTASGAAGILHEGARIRGVRLDDGATLAADRVLLAAG